MLSDDMIQLLTAYVDGELTPRQRDEAMRLLNKSAEAREVLRQLQENAHKVKQLKKHKVEPSLVDEILQAIAEEKSQRKIPAIPRRRRSLVPYFVGVMAASFLVIALGILSWMATEYFDGWNKHVQPPVVNNDRKQDPKGPEQPIPVVPTPKPANPLLAKMTESTFRDFGAPLPPPRQFNTSFAELQKGRKGEAQFIHDLHVEKSVQLDVVVKKNTDAVARLRDVLKGQGIKLVADPAAAKTVDDKKVEYLVYAENLTTKELAKLMNELSEPYVVAVGMNQKNVASPYQKLKLTPFEEEEKEKLAKLLGVNPKTLNHKEGKSDKVERTVVLLPGSSNGKQSKEVRQFVNQRRDPPPGAVQVLIRIRQE